MHPPSFIATKRDGNKHSEKEIRRWIEAYMQGSVTDYQMSAWTMAVYNQGMTLNEITALTLAMRDSGKVLNWSFLSQFAVDKHSTGGVGDKVSICLAPIVAACGVSVPMMSGRALGHTGGTLDKLESIPGFQVERSIAQFQQQVTNLGCALIGQTSKLAPADKRLYALRDVTATVESIPLITASILSKKLAEGIQGLVLDVKVGNGAFMKTEAEALTLARSLVTVGKKTGIQIKAVLTNMNQPLGNTIGNALEVKEAFEVLKGSGPKDLIECTFELGAHMLKMAQVVKTKKEAVDRMKQAIASGKAKKKMEEVVRAQKGNPNVIDDYILLPKSPHQHTVSSPKFGWIQALDTKALGLFSNTLGAGRNRMEDSIDHATGIVLHKKVGDKVEKDEPLATLHLKKTKSKQLLQDSLLKCFHIKKSNVPKPKLILRSL